MPSTPPEGEPAPVDGALPGPALAHLGQRPFALYVHVPYCATRCGYCDFNTYTADELGPGVSRASYADQAIAEVRLARRVLGARDLPVSSVFVGGGTPTLLPPGDLGRILAAIRDELGLVDGAEVTTEANPDSVDAAGLRRLREIDRRIRFLVKRLDAAEVVDPESRARDGADQVFFGATVEYATKGGERRTISIVGIDETDTARGYVSWISPVARALTRSREGDVVSLRTPAGADELEVLEVRYVPLATGERPV